jgi:hypothetical protein
MSSSPDVALVLFLLIFVGHVLGLTRLDWGPGTRAGKALISGASLTVLPQATGNILHHWSNLLHRDL